MDTNKYAGEIRLEVKTNLDEVEEQLDRIIAKLQTVNVLLNDVQAMFVGNEAPPMVQLQHWEK